jgi:hypothetical protein
MRTVSKGLFACVAAVTMTATTASAAIVCNEEGDCWRVPGEPRYYGPSLRLRVMPDDWRWNEGERYYYRWREPGIRPGYWRRGRWIDIEPEVYRDWD